MVERGRLDSVRFITTLYQYLRAFRGLYFFSMAYVEVCSRTFDRLALSPIKPLHILIVGSYIVPEHHTVGRTLSGYSAGLCRQQRPSKRGTSYRQSMTLTMRTRPWYGRGKMVRAGELCLLLYTNI